MKIIRHGIRQLVQILAPWKIVVGRIHADRLEHFRVFAQAIPLKSFCGDLAAIFVSPRSIELPQPALVLPRGDADEHALTGKSRRLFWI